MFKSIYYPLQPQNGKLSASVQSVCVRACVCVCVCGGGGANVYDQKGGVGANMVKTNRSQLFLEKRRGYLLKDKIKRPQ